MVIFPKIPTKKLLGNKPNEVGQLHLTQIRESITKTLQKYKRIKTHGDRILNDWVKFEVNFGRQKHCFKLEKKHIFYQNYLCSSGYGKDLCVCIN